MYPTERGCRSQTSWYQLIRKYALPMDWQDSKKSLRLFFMHANQSSSQQKDSVSTLLRLSAQNFG